MEKNVRIIHQSAIQRSTGNHSFRGINGCGCGKVTVNAYDFAGGWGACACGTRTINDSKWHMLDWVHTSNDKVTAYIDGGIEFSSSTNHITGTTSNLGFWGWMYTEQQTALVDDVAVVNGTDGQMPSAARIQRLYNEELSKYVTSGD